MKYPGAFRLFTAHGEALRVALVSFGLALMVAGAFYPLRFNEFIVCDDGIYITLSPRVTNGLVLQNIGWAFTSFYATNWHPLTWVSHMVDCQLWGLNPVGHHLTNLALHIASTVILFLACWLMTARVWASAFVAAVFGVHPLHVESVAWAAERKDVLSGLFFMLTLLAYAWYVRRPRWTRYLVVAVFLACGLMSKSMLVTTPFVLLLLDYWPLKRHTPIRFILLEKAPLLAMSVVSSVLTFLAQSRGGAVASVKAFSLGLRLENSLTSYIVYIGKAFWPTKLAQFYPAFVNLRSPATAFGAALTLLLITAVFVFLSRHRRYLLVGWLWYLGMLFPVVGIVQVGLQARADRYMYLPMIGLSMAVAWAVCELPVRVRQFAGAVALVAVACCCFLTWKQVSYWNDGLTLFRHSLEVAPENAFTRNVLGVELAARDNFEGAVVEFRRALEIDPTFFGTYPTLGRALMYLHRYDEAEVTLRTGERLNPRDFANPLNLGDLAATLGRRQEAIQHYLRALRIDPEQALAEQNLAMVYLQEDELGSAEKHLRRMLTMDVKNAEGHYQLAVVLTRQGRLDAADQELRRSLNLRYRAPQAHFDLAMLDVRRGRAAEAIQPLQEAVRIDPNYVPALQNLAWIRATHPDSAVRNPEEALRLAKRASESSAPKLADVVDTLAAAYAANGQFEEATSAARQALELAVAERNERLLQRLKQRLAGYAAHQAFIDESLRPRSQ